MSIGELKQAKANVVLGLDTSTQSVAWCLYDATGPVRWGEVSFVGKNAFERIADAQSKVRTVFKDVKPDVILFEAAAYIQNKQTVILLAMALGNILGAVTHPGTQVYSVPAITWQTVVGNPIFTKQEKEDLKKQFPDKSAVWLKDEMRRMRKERTAQLVETNYGIKSDNDNLTDAIMIAEYGYKTYGGK